MKHLVPANKLIAELTKEKLIKVRRAAPVGRELAKLIDELRRPPLGQELEDWLEEHRLVTEVFVSIRELDELVRRHIAPRVYPAGNLARGASSRAGTRDPPGTRQSRCVHGLFGLPARRLGPAG